jgi:hypothetical protein
MANYPVYLNGKAQDLPYPDPEAPSITNAQLAWAKAQQELGHRLTLEEVQAMARTEAPITLEQAKAKKILAVETALQTAVSNGFTHTDGNTYGMTDSDRQAHHENIYTEESINKIVDTDPIYVRDINSAYRPMTLGEFRIMLQGLAAKYKSLQQQYGTKLVEVNTAAEIADETAAIAAINAVSEVYS